MSNTSPLFTAAIICYNRADLVRASIESVLAQELDDFELVIVDDASTDNSADVLHEYSDQANIIVRDQNGGEMAARNTALAASRGEYICYLDSDDVWFPWTLRTFAEAICRHQYPTAIGGRLFPFRNASQLSDVTEVAYSDTVADCYLKSTYYMGVMSSAIRRSAIEQVGGFTEIRLNCLDSDLLFRIGDQPKFVTIVSPYTLAFRQHDGIMSNTKLSHGGALHLIETELAGKYPGGDVLRNDRLRQITRRTRNITLQFLRQSQFRLSLDIYRRTFAWNLRMRRWGYLGIVPLMAVCPLLRKLHRVTRG